MATTTQLRSWWSGYRCTTTKYVRVGFPGPTGPNQWNLWVAAPSAGLWRAFAEVMRKHGYLFRESAGGTYSCRKIAGTNVYSLHAYAIALDLNPSKNPYGSVKTDMPVAFRNDIKAITVDGQQAFTWGGDWSPVASKDTMHWQLNVSPVTAAKYQYDPGDEDVEELVKGLQRALNAAGFKGANGAVLTVDGQWGANTEFAHTAMCKAAAAPGTGTGLTAAQVDAKIALHAKVAPSSTVHSHRHDEGVTGPAVL